MHAVLCEDDRGGHLAMQRAHERLVLRLTVLQLAAEVLQGRLRGFSQPVPLRRRAACGSAGRSSAFKPGRGARHRFISTHTAHISTPSAL